MRESEVLRTRYIIWIYCTNPERWAFSKILMEPYMYYKDTKIRRYLASRREFFISIWPF